MTDKTVTINLRAVPEDVHAIIVEEKTRAELATGRVTSNPQAIYTLIRKAKGK